MLAWEVTFSLGFLATMQQAWWQVLSSSRPSCTFWTSGPWHISARCEMGRGVHFSCAAHHAQHCWATTDRLYNSMEAEFFHVYVYQMLAEDCFNILDHTQKNASSDLKAAALQVKVRTAPHQPLELTLVSRLCVCRSTEMETRISGTVIWMQRSARRFNLGSSPQI